MGPPLSDGGYSKYFWKDNCVLQGSQSIPTFDGHELVTNLMAVIPINMNLLISLAKPSGKLPALTTYPPMNCVKNTKNHVK